MGLATDIYGEGIRIPPIRLVRGGVLDSDTMRLLLANVRGNVERRGDSGNSRSLFRDVHAGKHTRASGGTCTP